MTAATDGLGLLCPACGAVLSRAEGGFRCGGCGTGYPERGGIIHLLSGQKGAPGYDPHFFRTLPLVEDRHFWFRARRQVILDALKAAVPDWRERPLFDVGCGTGGLLAFLAGAGVPIAGACDVYVDALKAARARVDVPLILVDEGGPPPLAAGQPMLGMFDVLEHIDDDEATLRWVRSVLAPGGVIVLTVPAHPFLFGEMDRLAHHRRRYRRRELGAKLQATGFEVLRLTHFMAPLVPLLAFTRGLRAVRPGPRTMPGYDAEMRVVPVVNEAMRLILNGERLWLRGLDLPLGSSVIAVARRSLGGREGIESDRCTH
jgi:SAM-dependent methyltransferase